MKPAVHAVSAAETALNVIGLPRLDSVRPFGCCTREIIRMNGIGRAPTFHFLERLAEIVQDLTVDNFDLTFRIHDGYETGNAFNRQPKPVFARADGLLGALTIVNLHRDSVPLEDISLFISKRYGTSQKPAVFPIRRAPACLILERRAGSQRRSPLVQMPINVVGVNRGLPTCAVWTLPRQTRVFPPVMTHEINGAVGQSGPNTDRNGFDHIPKLLLATEDRFLGPFPVRHVHYRAYKLAITGCIL